MTEVHDQFVYIIQHMWKVMSSEKMGSVYDAILDEYVCVCVSTYIWSANN